MLIGLTLLSSVALGMLAPQAFASNDRSEFLRLINDERADHGRGGLALSGRISSAAKTHSDRMADRGALFHTGSLSRILRGTSWQIAGENVGAGGDAQAVFDAFMASPEHRRNVLRGSFDHVGIGVTSSDGDLWVTFDFYG
jgi:uncharacterized protein YkwD